MRLSPPFPATPQPEAVTGRVPTPRARVSAGCGPACGEKARVSARACACAWCEHARVCMCVVCARVSSVRTRVRLHAVYTGRKRKDRNGQRWVAVGCEGCIGISLLFLRCVFQIVH